MKSPGIKRVYEPRARTDGHRVLVDRIWPRGIRKEQLADVTWLKDLAPSTALRKWFGHRPERWCGGFDVPTRIAARPSWERQIQSHTSKL